MRGNARGAVKETDAYPMPDLSVAEFHPWVGWVASIGLLAYFAFNVGIAVRVVMQHRSPGETLAWLLVVFFVPLLGLVLYFSIGELRLGARRERRFIELIQPVKQWAESIPERSQVDWSRLDEEFESLSRMCRATMGLPSLADNAVKLISDWQDVFARLIVDIDSATSTCHLEFYIWAIGGEADAAASALIRASQRGVLCRVLVDSLGSRQFLRSDLCQRMRDHGVQVQDALPGNLLRMPLVRFDLRLHRKIVVIDGEIAYTGSMNMVDPRYFKQDAGVGQWVDAMVRLEGPVVEALQITFLGDWFVETDDTLERLRDTGDATPQSERGDCAVQVMPSGPGVEDDAVEQVLITAIYSAEKELVLTTPYFVPSEPLSMALIAAARRGVKVVIIIPRQVDSMLVRFASNAFKGDLLQAGVRIARFDDGLLHTKSVSVDGTHCLFGSVNLDPRSFRLNFEILLAIYNEPFTQQLRALQQEYLDRSELIDFDRFSRRSRVRKFGEGFARLLAPLI